MPDNLERKKSNKKYSRRKLEAKVYRKKKLKCLKRGLLSGEKLRNRRKGYWTVLSLLNSKESLISL